MATHRPLAGRKLSSGLRPIFKQMAARLTPSSYTAYHKGTKEVASTDKYGQPTTKTVPIVRPEQHPVNHFRRLKRAWRRNGIDGFYAYLAKHEVGPTPATDSLPQA